MKVASLQFNPICENTYVVWDDTNECIVVDAGNSDERENARLKEFIDSRGLHPRMAVNTHGHFDHTLGVDILRRKPCLLILFRRDGWNVLFIAIAVSFLFCNLRSLRSANV